MEGLCDRAAEAGSKERPAKRRQERSRGVGWRRARQLVEIDRTDHPLPPG